MQVDPFHTDPLIDLANWSELLSDYDIIGFLGESITKSY